MGRLVAGGLLAAGLVLLTLVAGALAVGVWLVVNADAALTWLNGLLGKLQPIIAVVSSFTGG